MSKESYKMDMCNGPVLQKVIAFSLPLMLSSCLQLLFNAADAIFGGEDEKERLRKLIAEM